MPLLRTLTTACRRDPTLWGLALAQAPIALAMGVAWVEALSAVGEGEPTLEVEAPPQERLPFEAAWVEIPGGRFRMRDDASAIDDLKPAHWVEVPSFRLWRHEVTVGEYRACVGAGACSEPGTGEDCNYGVEGRNRHPVNCVSWNDAQRFVAWMRALGVDGARLPSEAEWEYAARGPGERPRTYPWGDEPAPTCTYAVMSEDGLGCGTNGTWEVCQKQEGNSPEGVCDLSGNVSEWVQDQWHATFDGAPSDGRPWESSRTHTDSLRVHRGGGWWSPGPGDLRGAYRNGSGADARNFSFGFRVAASSTSP